MNSFDVFVIKGFTVSNLAVRWMRKKATFYIRIKFRQDHKEVTRACRVELQDRERESAKAAVLGPLACPSLNLS